MVEAAINSLGWPYSKPDKYKLIAIEDKEDDAWISISSSAIVLFAKMAESSDGREPCAVALSQEKNHLHPTCRTKVF